MRKALIILAVVSFFTKSDGQYNFKSLQLSDSVETRYHGNLALEDGSFVSVGILQDETDTAQTTSHMVLTKLNCLGEIDWSKRLGGSIGVNNIWGTIVQADNGDIVFVYNLATGWFNSSALVARYTLDGDRVWAKRVGISEEYGRGITATNDGGFVIAGSTGTFGNDRARSDIYLVKLDANGNEVWNRTYGNDDAYDDAYTITEDSEGNLLTTGRYIVDGTFYGFVMKADPEGEPIWFKGYGQGNHRTFGYDLKETPEGDYLFSGYTTIAKIDWMSNGDCFLLKLDRDGDIKWAKIYEPSQSDRNDFGFSIVLEDDGDYGIILESSSFSAVGGAQAPNKQVVFSVTNVGKIKKVQLFNPKGSQYTRMTKAPDGGYFITGFSTYYQLTGPSVAFEPTAFKTDPEYLSGPDCEEWDRTMFVSDIELPWDVQDISYVESQGTRIVDYDVETNDGHQRSEVICFEFPVLTTMIIPVGGPFCRGEEIPFFDNTMGRVQTISWDFGDGNVTNERNPKYAYDTTGTLEVILTVSDGCRTVSDTIVVEINEGEVVETNRALCPLDSLTFRDSVITEPGEYRFTAKGSTGLCDSTFVLIVTRLFIDTVQLGTIEVCSKSPFVVNGENYSDPGNYTVNIDDQPCDSVVSFTLVKGDTIDIGEHLTCTKTPFEIGGQSFSKAGEFTAIVEAEPCDSIVKFTLFLSDTTDLGEKMFCPEDPFIIGGQAFSEEGEFTAEVDAEPCDSVVKFQLVLGENCKCLPDTFVNAFSPNSDGRNDNFGAFNPDCEVNVDDYHLVIYSRWGEKVFETKDPLDKWDGRFNGKDCPQDVYFMTVNYKGLKAPAKLDITLLR